MPHKIKENKVINTKTGKTYTARNVSANRLAQLHDMADKGVFKNKKKGKMKKMK